jgi:opacity protein-like surface antigen
MMSSSVMPDAPSAAPQSSAPTVRPRLYTLGETDLSVGVAGQLTTTRTLTDFADTQYIQSATPSVSLLATFHQQFHPFLGYNINFGFTRTTENYQRQTGRVDPVTGVTTGAYTRGSIPNSLYEISSAYVWKRPQLSTRFQPFAQTGGGILIFSPTDAPFAGHSSVRAALLFGAGIDYRLSDHFGLRAEYRGLMCKYPDFGAVTSTVPVSKALTVVNLPTVSFTYRFGHRGGLQ